MYLVVDNSADNQVSLFLHLNTKWVQGSVSVLNKNLLSALKDFCLSLGYRLNDIKGIAVVVGKGKFTSTRVAVTTANALAFSLNIPVLAVDQFDEDLDKRLAASPAGIYASALYSAPANIGVKNK